ncbi:putative ribonuclease H-like domain-containing protein [Tanacetum coccineum]
MVKPVWNNAQRVNHQNFAKKTHPCAKKNLVLRAVLMKSHLVSVNTAKQVNAAHSKTTVNAARPMSYLSKTAHSTGNPQMDLQDQGVIDSGCSRHMTGNMSYLTDYEEIDGGYVAFRGNPKGGKITRKGFFVGYSLNSKAFRVFNSRTRIVEENLHIRFSKSTPNVVGTQCLMEMAPGIKASDNAGQARKETEPVKGLHFATIMDAGPTNISQDQVFMMMDPNLQVMMERSSTINAAGTNEVNVVGGKTSIELSLIQYAYLEDSVLIHTRIHKDHPLDQVIGDLQSATQTRKMSKNLEEHGFIMDLPNGKRGYTQEEGIDYDEVFAPVARIEAIRLFLAYASFKDFVVYQMDVKSDFLYGKIEEEVYVCQPPGFEDPNFPDRVYKVEKVLYGLHQTPKAWYETLSTYLLDNGFQRGKIDKTLFIKRYKGDILLVQVYVDDIIFGSTKMKQCIAFKKLMHEEFHMSSMGELTFFLGLQVKQKKDGIFISQDKYIGEEVDVHMYRSMISSLMYLTSSRPDIMFAVYACARYQVNPKVSHLHAVKRIFRLISWQCKKQTVVANSTTEAEYVATSSCYGQVLWI